MLKLCSWWLEKPQNYDLSVLLLNIIPKVANTYLLDKGFSEAGRKFLYVFDARSEGASVHEKRQKKKVCFFRPIAVFNLGFFRSDDLVIWTVYAILAREDSNFF